MATREDAEPYGWAWLRPTQSLALPHRSTGMTQALVSPVLDLVGFSQHRVATHRMKQAFPDVLLLTEQFLTTQNQQLLGWEQVFITSQLCRSSRLRRTWLWC